MSLNPIKLLLDRNEQLCNEGLPGVAIQNTKNLCIESLNALAMLLFQRQNDIDGAVRHLRSAIAMDPEMWMTWSNLAHTLNHAHRFQEALSAIRSAIEVSGDTAPDAHYNEGVILTNMSRNAEAIESYRRGLLLSPYYGTMRYSLALLLLMKEQWEEGWKEYEWRLKGFANIIDFCGRLARPHWDGKDSLKGKTVLVYNEQGLGDYVMFMRFLPWLKSHGCKVIVELQKELISLVKDDPSVDQYLPREGVYPYNTQFPDHDYVISVCSLPIHFGYTRENRPSRGPYLTPPEKLSDGTTYSFPNNKKLKVGVVYSGCRWHNWDNLRSCQFREFAPLAMPGVDLYLLQKHDEVPRVWPVEGEVHLADGADFPFVEVGERIKEVADLAYFVGKMDLIVSVDTCVTHLAGGLGKPAWTLIATVNDWRWGEKSPRSHWYESVKLYRQKKYREWGPVLKRIATDLYEKSCQTSTKLIG